MISKLSPYVNFYGTAEEAFSFYKSIFGGEFLNIIRFGDMPYCNGDATENSSKIMHIALPIRGSLLMATDVSGSEPLNNDNRFSLAIHADNEQDADDLFAKISEGGTKMVPMFNADWGDYFGIVKDRFGIQWMISFPINKN